MVIEEQVLPILVWLFGSPAVDGSAEIPSALWTFAKTTFAIGVIGVVLGALISIFRYGPHRGIQNLTRVLAQTPFDLCGISARRVVGLSYLAVREALRRHVWVVLLLFVAILMFAGWNLAPSSDRPSVIYLNFVLTAATFLMLPVAVFMGAFSLPTDIKNRTIYTVVTKPVRPSEIVLGRILGFSLVATALLAIMALSSYIFVSRGLDHSHELPAEDIVTQTLRGDPVRYEGTTSLAQRHRHAVSIEVDEFFPEIELDAEPDAQSPDSQKIFVSRVGASAAGVLAGDVVEAIDGEPTATFTLDEAIRVFQGDAGSTVNLTVRRGSETQSVDLPRTIAENYTDTNRGHKHRVIARWSDDGTGAKIACEIGPPEGLFVARVPSYGRLRFRDSQGDPKDEKTWLFKGKGSNIGKIFSYRSYIRGNTLAAAIWTFEGVTPELYPNGITLDADIRVYRSHMGTIDTPIAGSIYVRNPDTGARSRERIFAGRELKSSIDQISIPRKVWNTRDQLVDLFDDDLVTKDDPSTPEDEGGRVEVWISCADPGQYFGMAQADVYIRARDASYTSNFIKGFLGIWLQIILVTSLAVLFSTFLSGPVAMLLSFTSVLLGFNKDFLGRLALSVLDPEKIQELATYKRVYGGGPIEAFYRIITQRNLVSELEEGALRAVIEKIDYSLMYVVEKILHLLPDFEQFVEVQYLSHGYNIQLDLLLQHGFATLAFLFAAYILGYFVLKSREMAR